VVPALCPLLASGERDTQLHTLRAIGNLCFDHDGNRELVLSSGGCPLLVDQLTSCSQLPAEREFDRLKGVACGCLLNTVNDNDKLCREVLSLGVLRPLSALLATPGEASSTISMGLRALYVLVSASGGDSKLVPASPLSRALSHLLGQCASADQLQPLLETVEVAIKANEEVKVAMVEAGCVDHLCRIADPQLQLKAIDLLILICANDDCLKLVAGHPSLVSTALDWLTEPSSLKRRANASLLLANMARTDEMCDLFISRGLVSHLLSLAQTEEPEELSGKVHVSALSTLRNLCLPATHKPVLVEKGVLKTALSCLRDSQWPHVHFKSLGIARLLATQQEEVCRELVLAQPGTVRLVCERCSTAQPPHVKIEGSRLLAAVIKHCKSQEVMRVVVGEGGVKLAVSLLDPGHQESLKNEALVALTLLAVAREGEGGREVGAALADEVVLGRVWGVVSDNETSPEVVSNGLTFLLQLAKLHPAANVGEKLGALDGFADKIKGLSQHSSDAVSNLASQLTSLVLK
jgi:hypothetical protein